MKVRALIVTVLLFALAVCASAQNGAPGADAGGRPRMDRVAPVVKDLGLTEVQIQSIRDAVTKFRTDARTATQGEGTEAEKQAKVEAAKTIATTAIKAVLTEGKVAADKQDEIVKQLIQGRRPGQGGPGGPGGPPPGAGTPPPPGAGTPPTRAPGARGNYLQGILNQLNLTDTQKADVEKINKASQEQIKAVQDDTTLTTEAKQAKMKELRTKSLEDIKALLTAEQKTKLEEIMKQRRPGRGN